MNAATNRRSLACANVTVALTVALISSASAQVTRRVSVSSAGAEGNGFSNGPAISADGRYVAFDGEATNFVPGDTNGFRDVFVRDRQNGATERVSLDSSGIQGNEFSFDPSISADGRFVAFSSRATNFVPVDANFNRYDIFVRDRQSSATELVSLSSAGVQGDHDSNNPSVSADGRYVAFNSLATNLVPGDTNAKSDIFVRDRQIGATERVSVDSAGAQANGLCGIPMISADGRFVAFESDATNLVPGDTNGVRDVFVRDRQSGTTERVSIDSSGGQGNGYSGSSGISADGRYVVYSSESTNLVPGDTNSAFDVFLRDRLLGTTERVSLDSSGTQGNGASFPAVLSPISADGRYVAFDSIANNLIVGDTNATYDGFLRDRQSGVTFRITLDSSGSQGNDTSFTASISPNGRYIAFSSRATNLVPGDMNATNDTFVHDRHSDVTPFCLGDGTNGPCPCGNDGAPGRGCGNSQVTGGAVLVAAGTASVSTDTLSFSASGLTGTVAIFFQGASEIAPAVVDDGIGCVGGPVVRLGTKPVGGAASSYPQAGDPPISVRGAVPPGGAVRWYQCFYRNAAAAFCPPATSNRTNGLSVAWLP